MNNNMTRVHGIILFRYQIHHQHSAFFFSFPLFTAGFISLWPIKKIQSVTSAAKSVLISPISRSPTKNEIWRNFVIINYLFKRQCNNPNTLEKRLFSMRRAIDNFRVSGIVLSRIFLCWIHKVGQLSTKCALQYLDDHTCWCSKSIANWNRSHSLTLNIVLVSSLKINYGHWKKIAQETFHAN